MTAASHHIGSSTRPLLGLRGQPGRLALWFMRLPRPLYHRGWGWMLGHTFLLITHKGRKTGKHRETVAMALTYDPASQGAVVCSAWGPEAEWIRNLRVHPALQIQIGRESYVPEQHFLSEDEAVAVATGFRDRHPVRLRLFAAILGWGDLGTESAMRELIRSRPFVAFTPADDTGHHHQRTTGPGLGGVAQMKTTELSRSLGEIAVASPLFLFAPLYRHWHLRWGATDAEIAAPMPGDELVPQPSFNTTRAITIDAPPEDVWPWLVQIGYRRAGFYSYDLFDNGGHPSANQILAEYQHPRVGDWMPMAPKVNETTAFRVREIDTNRSLLWEKPHSTWAWKLEPLSDGRTRLVTRLKDRYSWRADPVNALLSIVLFEFGDFPMMRKLLRGVKRRAEHLQKGRISGAPVGCDPSLSGTRAVGPGPPSDKRDRRRG